MKILQALVLAFGVVVIKTIYDKVQEHDETIKQHEEALIGVFDYLEDEDVGEVLINSIEWGTNHN